VHVGGLGVSPSLLRTFFSADCAHPSPKSVATSTRPARHPLLLAPPPRLSCPALPLPLVGRAMYRQPAPPPPLTAPWPHLRRLSFASSGPRTEQFSSFFLFFFTSFLFLLQPSTCTTATPAHTTVTLTLHYYITPLTHHHTTVTPHNLHPTAASSHPPSIQEMTRNTCWPACLSSHNCCSCTAAA
jgi:hypothetical protein